MFSLIWTVKCRLHCFISCSITSVPVVERGMDCGRLSENTADCSGANRVKQAGFYPRIYSGLREKRTRLQSVRYATEKGREATRLKDSCRGTTSAKHEENGELWVFFAQMCFKEAFCWYEMSILTILFKRHDRQKSCFTLLRKCLFFLISSGFRKACLSLLPL